MRIVKVVVECLDGRFGPMVAEAVQACGSIQVELGDWRSDWAHTEAVGRAKLVHSRRVAVVRIVRRRDVPVADRHLSRREA